MAVQVLLASGAAEPSPVAATGPYAVVASEATCSAPEWWEVVEALRKKHDAALVVYESSVAETLDALREIRPRYIGFVARPEEAGRAFVVAAHRLTRRLDDDPYGDALWGIITGYDAADALRMARAEEPLALRRGLSGFRTDDLDVFEEALGFDEWRAGGRWVKKAGEPPVLEDFPADSTKGLVDGLNEFRPDVFMTSGHATEKDWRIGYTYPDGSFRCENGRLYGLDLQGRRFDVDSPNRKVFLGVGNCLIGHISERDCMALALMHSAGVDQMYGYTVVTFYGYMGWGTRSLLFDGRGRHTLAQAFYLANQALIRRLDARYPEVARVDWDDYSDAGLEALKKIAPDEDALGLLWDRDTVAFYGDPAWAVHALPGDRPWDCSLSEENGTYTFRLTTRTEGEWRPKYYVPEPMILFPRRLKNIRVKTGEEYMPVLTENFLLLPLDGPYRAGEVHDVVFEAEPMEEKRTSAASPPLRVSRATVEAAAEEMRAAAAELAPPERVEDVARALREAGANAEAIASALRDAPAAHKSAVLFLVGNAPRRDLESLSAEFLLENAALAYAALEAAPWGRTIPEDVFLNGVLPYANFNERRDNWRRDFFERFRPLVKDCRTPGEAAQVLNRDVFALLKVHYHARRRPKPDQSPYETIAAGYASCTGLSILLADACRAVGVPARLAGTPQWTTKRGNHTWVEVWSEGDWHFLGAAEYNPAGLDRAWFVDDAAKANAADPRHRIYAVSFRRTGMHFPLVWDLGIRYVSAEDVTARYAGRGAAETEDVRYVWIQAFDADSGERVAAEAVVYRGDEAMARGLTRDASHDTNDVLAVPLRVGERYDVEVRLEDGRVRRRGVEVSEEPVQEVRFEV